MNFLVVSGDVLHTDAIVDYIKQSGKLCYIQTTQCYIEATYLCERHMPEVIILDHDMHPMGQAHWVDKLRQIPMMATASYITLVSEIRPIELAKIVATNINVILHVYDAGTYFKEVLFQNTTTNTYLSPKISGAMGYIPPKSHPLYTLSKTELEIATLLLQDFNTKQIADKLQRTKLTIEAHRKNIKEKLSVTGGKGALLTYLIPYTQWLIGIKKLPHF